MADDDWQPGTYDDVIASVPGYAELQRAVLDAVDRSATSVLELGVGTGETTRRLLAALPDARITGIDASAAMVDHAVSTLPTERVTVIRQRIEDELPPGHYDAVVSVLAVHHLTDDDKAELFRRVHGALRAGGRFVLGDVVVPRDPQRARVELEPEVDLPAPVDSLLRWARDAGFAASVTYEVDDLVVVVGRG